MDEKMIREIVNSEIDKRLAELNESSEGIVMVKTPLELDIERKQKEKDWVQKQL